VGRRATDPVAIDFEVADKVAVEFNKRLSVRSFVLIAQLDVCGG
jgi:hypothetical protein